MFLGFLGEHSFPVEEGDVLWGENMGFPDQIGLAEGVTQANQPSFFRKHVKKIEEPLHVMNIPEGFVEHAALP